MDNCLTNILSLHSVELLCSIWPFLSYCKKTPLQVVFINDYIKILTAIAVFLSVMCYKTPPPPLLSGPWACPLFRWVQAFFSHVHVAFLPSCTGYFPTYCLPVCADSLLGSGPLAGVRKKKEISRLDRQIRPIIFSSKRDLFHRSGVGLESKLDNIKMNIPKFLHDHVT